MSLSEAQRISGIQRTLIREIFDGAPADAINLGLGQPDLPTPEPIARGGIAAIEQGKTGYTSTGGNLELRAAIAARYPAAASGPGSVLITIGSQEAMFVSALALVDPGQTILYPDPSYPAYPVVARLIGAEGVPYPLRRADGFRIDPAAIAERLDERTGLVVISEPSNPTGSISRNEDLDAVTALLSERGIPWISDEIYSGFSYDREFVSMGERAPGGGLVISGLSKNLSMTGWRIGWVVGPEAIVSRIVAVHQYLVTCASSVSQAAAQIAFTDEGRREAGRYLEIFRGRRALMAEELARVPGLRFALPEGAFYFFVDASAHGDCAALARRILANCNVVVIPGVAFGEAGAGFLRISYAAGEEQIRTGIQRIARELT